MKLRLVKATIRVNTPLFRCFRLFPSPRTQIYSDRRRACANPGTGPYPDNAAAACVPPALSDTES